MKFCVIHQAGGITQRHDYDTEGKLIAGLAALGARLIGLQGSPAPHGELTGCPIFDRAAGPTWDGDRACYELTRGRERAFV